MRSEQRGRTADEVVERIREAVDIVELIGEYVTLRRSGRSFKGLCPFHTEKTPSFTVNPDRQAFYCFGCQKGGDVYTFVMEHDGVGFAEALRMLGRRAGIEVTPRARPDGMKEACYRVVERAAQFFTATLHGDDGARARQYLQERGIDRATAERFRLGAAPASWEALARALQAEGFEADLLRRVGLVGTRSSDGSPYDLFRNRLIFPILSLSDRVLGFGGRILPGPGSQDAPKYVNSADSPIYHKGQVLYGLGAARAAIRRQEAAVITEGYLDHLSLFQRGIENVVAACGTAFAPQQAALLHRYTHRAYILGDSDAAGRRAAVRTAGLLLEHGFLVHVVELPEGYDPDSYVREFGAAALEKAIREAPGYIAYMKRLVDRRAGNLAVKERVVRHLLGDLRRVSDPLLQELFTKEICRSFALSEATVSAALEAPEASARARRDPVEPDPPPPADVPASLREARHGLLRLGLTEPVWVEALVHDFEPGDFGDGVEHDLFLALRAAGKDGHWRDHVSGTGVDSFGSRLEIQGPLPGEPERLYQDYRARLLEARLVAASAELDVRIQEAQRRGDQELLQELARERQALARDRSGLRRLSPLRSHGRSE